VERLDVPAHVRRPNRRWRPVRLTFPTTSVEASVTRVTGVPSRRRDSPFRTRSFNRRSQTRHDGLCVNAVLASQQRADEQVAGETLGGCASVRRIETRRAQAKGIPSDK